jgi:hypothetical protein
MYTDVTIYKKREREGKYRKYQKCYRKYVYSISNSKQFQAGACNRSRETQKMEFSLSSKEKYTFT